MLDSEAVLRIRGIWREMQALPSAAELAAEYKMNVSNLRKIARGETYKWVR